MAVEIVMVYLICRERYGEVVGPFYLESSTLIDFPVGEKEWQNMWPHVVAWGGAHNLLDKCHKLKGPICIYGDNQTVALKAISQIQQIISWYLLNIEKWLQERPNISCRQ